MKDEGIVQAISKEVEQLSRRLHQKCGFSGEIQRARFSSGRIRFIVESKRAVNRLPVECPAYIAGLIDGEGTITLTRLHANENRRLVISIANTEFQLLEFVINRVGAGKITRKRTNSDRHTPSYCYSITSRQALALLRQISPFLQSYKRRRADLALERYELLTPRNGKYSVDRISNRRRFEQDFLSVKATRRDKAN